MGDVCTDSPSCACAVCAWVYGPAARPEAREGQSPRPNGDCAECDAPEGTYDPDCAACRRTWLEAE